MNLPLIRDTFKDKWPRVFESAWSVYVGVQLVDTLYIKNASGATLASLSKGYLQIFPGYAFDVVGDKTSTTFLCKVVLDALTQMSNKNKGKLGIPDFKKAVMNVLDVRSSSWWSKLKWVLKFLLSSIMARVTGNKYKA